MKPGIALGVVAVLLGGCATHEPASTILPDTPLQQGARLAVESTTPSIPSLPTYHLPPLEVVHRDIIASLRSQGMYQFRQEALTQLKLEGQHLVSREGDHFNVGLGWGTGVEAAIVNGKMLDKNEPISVVTPSPTTMIVNYPSTHVKVEFEAVDLSGRPMQPYMRTDSGGVALLAYFMDNQAIFPAGSLGYRARITPDSAVLLAPTVRGFTGANTLEALSERFGSGTPFCLRYNARLIEHPMGIAFEKGIVKKMQGKGKAAREVEQIGTADVYATSNQLLCQKLSSTPLDQATWTLGYVHGTRTLRLTMPESLKSENYGVKTENRAALMPAFAQVQEDRSVRVVPAIYWQADQTVNDPTLRFNEVAAQALSQAMQRAMPAYRAWQASSNQNSVAQRAEMIRRRNAPLPAATQAQRVVKPAATSPAQGKHRHGKPKGKTKAKTP